MEGTPGHMRRFAFTRGSSRWPRPLPIPKSRRTTRETATCAEPRREGARALREEGEATGVSEARSPSAPWCRKRPRPLLSQRGPCRTKTRRSGRGCRETPLPPVTVPRVPEPVGHPGRESVRASRERTRYGYTSFVRLADVGRMHRSPLCPEGRKARRTARAIAGRKRTAPLTRSVRGEKANRCTSLRASHRSSWRRFAGFGSQAHGTTEGALGLSPRGPHRSRGSQGPTARR